MIHHSPGWSASRVLLACLVLAVLAFAWRFPLAAERPVTTDDEVLYSRPSVLRMASGDWLFYVAGTNYGAPVQEALAVPLLRAFGDSPVALRTPVLLLGAVGVALSFLLLLHVIPAWSAFAAALLLALGNSVIIRYTTFAHPCYATLTVLVPLLQLLTFCTDNNRRWSLWLLLGLTMGFSLYVLKLAIFAIVISLVWLWWRSEHGLRFRASWNRPHLLYCGAGLLLGLTLVLPVLYRFLTRRASFAAAPFETVLLVIGGGIVGAALIAFLPLLFRQTRRREWLHAGICVIALYAVPIPAEVWYRTHEKPRLEASGLQTYAEPAYCWKHAHEWPKQARILLEGVIPAMIVGRATEMEADVNASWPSTWRSALSALSIGLLVYGLWRKAHKISATPRFAEGDYVIVAPPLLVVAVMFPSWSLFSDHSYRYLIPFLPGLCLLVYRAWELPLRRHRRVVGALVAAYLVYCGFDVWYFTA